MMHVSMILQIMHISLMHISMMWGYPECYRGDGEERLLQGDSRSRMHVSSDRLDACMMHISSKAAVQNACEQIQHQKGRQSV